MGVNVALEARLTAINVPEKGLIFQFNLSQKFSQKLSPTLAIETIISFCANAHISALIAN